MTVIIRSENKIRMIMKGADNMVRERLHKTADQPFLTFVNKQINDFSVKGLRTLLVAMKILEEEEYQKIDQEYQKLSESDNREKAIAQLANKIETDLFLIGATGKQKR